MELTEAIEVQQHLINAYSAGKKINLPGMSDFMNAQYQKYIESCTIAITLMTQASQKSNYPPNTAVAIVADNRIYKMRMKEAEASGDKQQIKNIAAIKSVADLHKITFTEMCNIINELAALQGETQI